MSGENPSMLASLAATDDGLGSNPGPSVDYDGLNATAIMVFNGANVSEEVMAMLEDCPDYDDEDMKYVDKVNDNLISKLMRILNLVSRIKRKRERGREREGEKVDKMKNNPSHVAWNIHLLQKLQEMPCFNKVIRIKLDSQREYCIHVQGPAILSSRGAPFSRSCDFA